MTATGPLANLHADGCSRSAAILVHADQSAGGDEDYDCEEQVGVAAERCGCGHHAQPGYPLTATG